jgi:hypothetical protein
MTAAWTVKDSNGQLLAQFVAGSRLEVGRRIVPTHFDAFRLHVSQSYRELFDAPLRQRWIGKAGRSSASNVPGKRQARWKRRHVKLRRPPPPPPQLPELGSPQRLALGRPAARWAASGLARNACIAPMRFTGVEDRGLVQRDVAAEAKALKGCNRRKLNFLPSALVSSKGGARQAAEKRQAAEPADLLMTCSRPSRHRRARDSTAGPSSRPRPRSKAS